MTKWDREYTEEDIKNKRLQNQKMKAQIQKQKDEIENMTKCLAESEAIYNNSLYNDLKSMFEQEIHTLQDMPKIKFKHNNVLVIKDDEFLVYQYEQINLGTTLIIDELSDSSNSLNKNMKEVPAIITSDKDVIAFYSYELERIKFILEHKKEEELPQEEHQTEEEHSHQENVVQLAQMPEMKL